MRQMAYGMNHTHRFVCILRNNLLCKSARNTVAAFCRGAGVFHSRLVPRGRRSGGMGAYNRKAALAAASASPRRNRGDRRGGRTADRTPLNGGPMEFTEWLHVGPSSVHTPVGSLFPSCRKGQRLLRVPPCVDTKSRSCNDAILIVCFLWNNQFSKNGELPPS